MMLKGYSDGSCVTACGYMDECDQSSLLTSVCSADQ